MSKNKSLVLKKVIKMNLIRNKNIILNINNVTIIFFVICLTFSTSLLSFLNPQLHGEDEALTFLG